MPLSEIFLQLFPTLPYKWHRALGLYDVKTHQFMQESSMVKEDKYTSEPLKGLTEIYCLFCDGGMHEIERTDKLVCDEEPYCIIL